jgi:hypothetical protein
MVIPGLVSPSAFPLQALTTLTLSGWASNSYGMDPTPLQIEGFKMAERSGLRTPGLAAAMVLAAAAGLFAGYVALLIPIYRLGADSSKPFYWPAHDATSSFSILQDWLTGAQSAPSYQWLAMSGASLFALGLYGFRARFIGFPLHPIGYVMAPMWYTHRLWVSVFIAWAVKALLLRYGGLRAYARALPLFFGFILGDCVVGSVWTLVDAFHHLPAMDAWI